MVVAQRFERHEGISQAAMSPPIVISVLQFVYRAQLICVPSYKTFMYCLFVSQPSLYKMVWFKDLYYLRWNLTITQLNKIDKFELIVKISILKDNI